ncbi:MAG: YdeI/OmpD-associated family protein [Gammaproteobacteria bacterium]|nr:YdeI/OmpD-associated family protein [Gammaproteobacteria bacterium]MDH4315821.1 YdeI/OmpD-associated family protein [Gammaproteobacteria bacterium]MDH5215255.1 YdeI/OmpD-associated family protein [Gammaproteobacteria bacterium]
MLRHKSVDAFIDSAEHWQSELKSLRRLLLASGLAETIKWGGPCYTFEDKNIVGLGAFKSYFGLWFFQGALLADKAGVLINAQEGRTKALRQWRMNSAKDIRQGLIKSYLKEAIAIVESGRKIKADRSRPIVVPEELRKALAKNSRARSAFDGLRPGLQREYTDYVAQAKREDTRLRRIEKILPMIASGAGLNDKYR